MGHLARKGFSLLNVNGDLSIHVHIDKNLTLTVERTIFAIFNRVTLSLSYLC